MGFLNHIRVLNIKIISQINLFLIFLKKTIDKYKIKSENELSCVGKAIAQDSNFLNLSYDIFIC
jgi:hypothetical protein